MVLEELQEGNAKASRGCLLWAHRQRHGHRELSQAYAVRRLAVDEDFTFPSVSQFIVGGFKWPERTNASQ